MWLKYVFSNCSETPQRLIEFITTIYTYPRMAFEHLRLQIWWFEAELWKKSDFQWENNWQEMCIW